MAEQDVEGRLSEDALLDHYLRVARQCARQLIVHGVEPDIKPGLILVLPTDEWVVKVEDNFTRVALRLLLESDSTSAWRAKQDAVWQDDPSRRVKFTAPAGPRRGPEPKKRRTRRIRRSADATVGDGLQDPDAVLVRRDEARSVLRHVYAVATTRQQVQLQRLWHVLRENPDTTIEEAFTAAGITTDQRKKLTTRLPARLREHPA